ncbi:hypothetical protein [Simplicispira suum]|uniref:Transmembrane protein n=1 Tax=Simplicispira suum TaxID=2109915 RepID=A0A2S0N3V1_9BURK|nr:hypothetical protein [Simplicispira suum]AVO42613.1 hypothetical protein C6571_16100 [Simplicispira suum]
MYLIVIAWLYVVVLMAVAEATSTTGSVLGALITFALYGALPLSIVIYILGTPGRRRKIRAREVQERQMHERTVAAQAASQASAQPDAGSHAPGAAAGPATLPVREEA